MKRITRQVQYMSTARAKPNNGYLVYFYFSLVLVFFLVLVLRVNNYLSHVTNYIAFQYADCWPVMFI